MSRRLGALAVGVVGVLGGCSGGGGGSVATLPAPSVSTIASGLLPSTGAGVTTLPPTSVIPPGPTVPLPEDGMWHFDFGAFGTPGMRVGERSYYNGVTIGNSGADPIRLDRVTFPEIERGLVVTRVGLRPESDEEIAAGESPFPVDALPFDGTVILEPTNADVPDPFTDPRFHSVFVEFEVVAEGQWSIGPMDLTYTVNGITATKRIGNQAGDACTTPIDVMCMPHAS